MLNNQGMISYPHYKNRAITNIQNICKEVKYRNVILYFLDVEILVEYTDNNGDKILYATE